MTVYSTKEQMKKRRNNFTYNYNRYKENNHKNSEKKEHNHFT